MKTIPALACAASLTLAASGLAYAASPTNEPNQNTTNGNVNDAATAHHQRIESEVRQSLQNAGFTDIKVMPESLLVRAKDKQGRPVMMVVNPDSVTAVIDEGSNANSTSAKPSGNSNSPSDVTGTTQPKE